MKTLEQLNGEMEHILAAPSDSGPVALLCVRPEEGQRLFPATLELSVKRGAVGDNWEQGTWLSLKDGSPSPEVQVSILPKRIFDSICGGENGIHPGDTVIADLDLSENNLPVGQQLQLGTAIVQVSNVPNYGCSQWAERYGKDALRFVAQRDHRRHRLRGVLCRIVKDGFVSVGDSLSPIRKR